MTSQPAISSINMQLIISTWIQASHFIRVSHYKWRRAQFLLEVDSEGVYWQKGPVSNFLVKTACGDPAHNLKPEHTIPVKYTMLPYGIQHSSPFSNSSLFMFNVNTGHPYATFAYQGCL